MFEDYKKDWNEYDEEGNLKYRVVVEIKKNSVYYNIIKQLNLDESSSWTTRVTIKHLTHGYVEEEREKYVWVEGYVNNVNFEFFAHKSAIEEMQKIVEDIKRVKTVKELVSVTNKIEEFINRNNKNEEHKEFLRQLRKKFLEEHEVEIVKTWGWHENEYKYDCFLGDYRWVGKYYREFKKVRFDDEHRYYDMRRRFKFYKTDEGEWGKEYLNYDETDRKIWKLVLDWED